MNECVCLPYEFLYCVGCFAFLSFFSLFKYYSILTPTCLWICLSVCLLISPYFLYPAGFLECLKQLVLVDKEWIPDQDGYSLYIRPTAIGTSPYLGVQAPSHAKVSSNSAYILFVCRVFFLSVACLLTYLPTYLFLLFLYIVIIFICCYHQHQLDRCFAFCLPWVPTTSLDFHLLSCLLTMTMCVPGLEV